MCSRQAPREHRPHGFGPDHITGLGGPRVRPLRGGTIIAGRVIVFPSFRLVAFDATSVSGARLTRGLRGPRLRSLDVIPLAPGALLPSALAPNLARPEEVVAALVQLSGSLGRGPVTLVLPHGLARVLLLEAPKGADPREYARFRLGPALPYPLGEAVVDLLALDGRRLLAAAVRREVVAGYEAAATAAGLAPERVDLAPLAALSGLLRQRRPASVVEILLGDAALSLAAFDGEQLCAFRSRWRDPGPGEAERVHAEAVRTSPAAGEGLCLRVTGVGARGLRDDLLAAGHPAELAAVFPGSLPEAAERPWLGAVWS